jgi:hypothetical protein
LEGLGRFGGIAGQRTKKPRPEGVSSWGVVRAYRTQRPPFIRLKKACPPLDQAIALFLDDLEQRGLVEEHFATGWQNGWRA